MKIDMINKSLQVYSNQKTAYRFHRLAFILTGSIISQLYKMSWELKCHDIDQLNVIKTKQVYTTSDLFYLLFKLLQCY